MCPPSVAFPINAEKAAPNNPVRKREEAYSPKVGSSARDISVAVFTVIPCGCNTAPAQIITIALITP